ncbi:zinc-binding dehydrogenase [Pseudonocardia benzenivorans]|uniref:L-iditol 2-dehydrogenase n=2 Tax=Pseudonocardia TaxID=1847 RepID=F4CJM4_PSEUX|nr:alcohol dehydrogenase catalytic domain-containing protein [Pseudonocardia dioxanivorans]AEA25884.1 L-iditol 2-dehydrogenase [Pseudonocardia dioxanivorans CB1190]GJF06356.1 alcohol dehydrogenase [Pseudonocardia sp. D17]
MRAGVFRGKGRIEVEDVPDPVAGPDDVVLDLYGCGVCGSDIGQFRSGTARAGQVMGHEFAGTVVEVGSRVQGIVEGDRLTGLPIQPCGDCRRCRAGLAHLCERWTTRSIAFGLPGGFAERLHIPAARLGHNVHRLPDLPGGAGAALEAGTLVEPLSVAVHAVRLADAGPGRSAVVTGLGTIGLQAAQTLRAKGCTPVIGVDPSPLRRSVAEGLGIVTVDPTVGEEALAGTLSALTGEAEADIVVEASGVGALVAGAIEIVRPRGTVVLVALYHSPATIEPMRAVQREVVLRGSANVTPEDFRDSLELVGSGAVATAPLISHRMPLERVQEAFEAQLDARASVKVLVTTS